ncbi:MAG TPA: malonyl CoA-acyl carrier protein transacylase [Actinobacteria bacterium]|nr:malonyl CoA-acyl carrier protein transacylase [Actinomycetota bacterium]
MNNGINAKDNPKIALMFPGQGSQYEKMGQQFLRFNGSSYKYFEIAGEIIGKDLTKIVNGQDPDNNLGDTKFSQISIYALSCALFDYLSKDLSLDMNSIDTVMGHSLGEYSALYSCGAFDFRAGAELVAYRGNIMSNADRSAKGMMAAVLGAEAGPIRDILKEYRDRVFIANYNDYTQIVISGYEEDVKNAMAGLKGKGIKKVIPLKVNIASHCPLMGEVSKELGSYIDKNISFKEPVPPFLSTTEAKITGKSELRKTLTGQLTNPIRWVDSVKFLLDKGVNTFIEIGPGKVLSGLVLRIARKNKKNIDIMNTKDLGDIENLIGKLQERGLLR